MEIKYDDEYCKGCEHKDIYVKESPVNMLGFGPTEYELHCQHEDICAVWKERLSDLHDAMRKEVKLP